MTAGEIGPHDFIEKATLKAHTFTEYIKVLAIAFALPVSVVFYTLKWLLSPEHRSHTLLQYLQTRVPLWAARYMSIDEMRILLRLRPLRQELLALGSGQREGLNNFNGLFKVDGASARWLIEVENRQKDDPVVLYFHGGAYFLKVMPPQLIWLVSLARKMNAKGHRLSILILDYTVTPYKMFPGQLDEARAVYTRLTETCEKIITLGDSAGGNLAIALTDVISEENLPKCWALALISPWAALVHRESGSYIDHDDYLELSDRYWRLFCTAEQLVDPRVNPIMGKPAYWVDKIPKRHVCIWGQREILRDTCKEWAESANITNIYEEQRGVHDVMCLSPRRPGSRYVFNTIDSWLSGDESGGVGVNSAIACQEDRTKL